MQHKHFVMWNSTFLMDANNNYLILGLEIALLSKAKH